MKVKSKKALDKYKFEDIGPNLKWSTEFCKRCGNCLAVCPKKNLKIINNQVIEENNCIYCGLCEIYCPDFAISVKNKKKPTL